MLASQLIAAAATELNDDDLITWTQDDHIEFINSAQRQVAVERPDASQTSESIALVAGTKQTIPAGYRRLLDITRNMGADGLTPGKPIIGVDRASLDLANQYWHSATGKTSVQNYTYDEKTPEIFYVSPPVKAGEVVQIEAVFSTVPAEVTDPADELAINDIYYNAILDWMLYRAFSVEVDSANSGAMAARHYAAFGNFFDKKYKIDIGFSPSKEISK